MDSPPLLFRYEWEDYREWYDVGVLDDGKNRSDNYLIVFRNIMHWWTNRGFPRTVKYMYLLLWNTFIKINKEAAIFFDQDKICDWVAL